jgi:hypothetical protein
MLNLDTMTQQSADLIQIWIRHSRYILLLSNLLGGELGELDVESSEMGEGHLLVQLLGQHHHANLNKIMQRRRQMSFSLKLKSESCQQEQPDSHFGFPINFLNHTFKESE